MNDGSLKDDVMVSYRTERWVKVTQLESLYIQWWNTFHFIQSNSYNKQNFRTRTTFLSFGQVVKKRFLMEFLFLWTWIEKLLLMLWSFQFGLSFLRKILLYICHRKKLFSWTNPLLWLKASLTLFNLSKIYKLLDNYL